MSLKAIHVLFICASTALALLFAGWGVIKYRSPEGGAEHLVYTILALAGAVALVVYGVKFLKKMKHISYL